MADQKVYKIASVCGSGYATSGWIKAKLTEELKVRGIAVEVEQLKAIDLASVARDYDLIVSASNLDDVYDVPVVTGISIITGVGLEKTMQEIVEKLTGLTSKENE